MAYNKPGVEITQVQESGSPTLITQDLTTTVVGKPYYVVTTDDTTATVYNFSAGTSPTFSGTGAGSYDVLFPTSVSGTVDTNSLYVDIYCTSGTLGGKRIHLTSDDTALSTSATNTSGFKLTIADPATWVDAYAATPAAGISGIGGASISGSVQVGYNILRADVSGFLTYDSQGAISSTIGKVTPDNNLAYGLYLAMLNSNSQTHGISVRSNTPSENVTEATSILELNETYAIVPLEMDAAENYSSHVNSMSTATNKKERIVIGSKAIGWTTAAGASGSATSYDAYQTAITTKGEALAKGEKRTIYVRPDLAYVRATLPLQKVSAAYIADTWSDIGAKAILASTIILSDNTTKYTSGTELTDTIWQALRMDYYGDVDVYYPVPGYMLAACVAGQVSGEAPEQGFTNLPIVGIDFIRRSKDIFSETNLNYIAEGGNYLMQQGSDSSPISSRHQLSTDMSTVEKRELSITKSVDFCAKFLRRTLSPYIGRYLITTQFIKFLTGVLNSAGLFLVREGHINDFKVIKVEQDTSQPDTINVEFNILVKYPVNYIKVSLIF